MSRWQELGKRVFEEMDAWRQAHPRPTFAEIEAAVEDRLGGLRAELIEEEVAARAQPPPGGATERPVCPECGRTMDARGQRERVVTVRGNRQVRWQRTYAVCPSCGVGLFPPG